MCRNTKDTEFDTTHADARVSATNSAEKLIETPKER